MLLNAKEILMDTEYAEWSAMAIDKYESDSHAVNARIDVLVSALVQPKLERTWDQ